MVTQLHQKKSIRIDFQSFSLTGSETVAEDKTFFQN